MKETRHRVYVASSWRNPDQPAVVEALRRDGHDVYDFKVDAGSFGWREIGEPSAWTPEHFSTNVLDHPLAARGFGADMNALVVCSACVLVLPCGRSAHLELGYAVGMRKLTIVYMPAFDEPELMYRMCDYVEPTLDRVRTQLSRSRTAPRWQADLLEGTSPRFDGRCREYAHRDCVVCGNCWRHGSCTCGPVAPRLAA